MYYVTKFIFFNNRKTADRFVNLYGGFVDVTKPNAFALDYFGEQSKNKVLVMYRTTKDDMKSIMRDIDLKEIKWNGHLCYVFES